MRCVCRRVLRMRALCYTFPLRRQAFPLNIGNPIRTCFFPKIMWATWPREVTKKLIAAKAIEATALPKVTERVHAALLEELTLEDRINDEVRVILEAYSEEMNKTGANYQEMFRQGENRTRAQSTRPCCAD